MENRFLALAAALILQILFVSQVLGADAEQQADWQNRMDKAAALQQEAKNQQREAIAVLGEKNLACQKKFFVNACLKESENEYMAATRQGKRLENEGLAIEREVKKEQLKDKDAKHQAEAAQRQAELPGREAEISAERQSNEAKAAAMQADKERKAEAGLKRKAAEAEKLRQRQAAHDARVAEKMEKARRQPAETASNGQ